MAKPDLHSFIKDLRSRPVAGSNAPPVSIRAKDLDDNFKKVTIIPSEAFPPEYQVAYREDGVILSDLSGLPPEAIAKEFSVCENGLPATYWFVVWKDKPEV